KYTIMINGVTQLNMMKADVLSIFDEIKVCTHYEYDGQKLEYLPYNLDTDKLKPVYESVPGWKVDLTELNTENSFPKELSNYISYLEAHLQTPITIVSLGPDRKQTILRKPVAV